MTACWFNVSFFIPVALLQISSHLHSQKRSQGNNAFVHHPPIWLRYGPFPRRDSERTPSRNKERLRFDAERPFKLLGDSKFEYHAPYSPDGKWIIFTSERNGDGNSGLYRSRSDGSGLERLLVTPSFESAAVLSSNWNQVAYVSTANSYKANIWVMDLTTGSKCNLTNTNTTVGDPIKPDGHFRPISSPNGNWNAFSSDRNTNWTGHNNGTGWEHTQELSSYVIRPDETGFRKLASKSGYCLGSPKLSPDVKRVVYYETTVHGTWDAHQPNLVASAISQIVSVDFTHGVGRVEHTSGSGMKIFPQNVTEDEIGYLIKGGSNKGLSYTSNRTAVQGEMRPQVWSPGGNSVVYEKLGYTTRPMEKVLYSWGADWEYRLNGPRMLYPHLAALCAIQYIKEISRKHLCRISSLHSPRHPHDKAQSDPTPTRKSSSNSSSMISHLSSRTPSTIYPANSDSPERAQTTGSPDLLL